MNQSADLVGQLNNYPKYARLEPDVLTRAYETITQLLALYEVSDLQERRAIAAGLRDSAKYILADYAIDQANDGRRSLSEDVIRRDCCRS